MPLLSTKSMKTNNKLSAVVIDIDNTIIDTAIRKKSLLSRMGMGDVDINVIRKDFWLKTYLGDNSGIHKQFFSYMKTEDYIKTIKAPLLDQYVTEALDWLKKEEIETLFVSSRNSNLLDATFNELKSHGIITKKENIYLLSSTLRESTFENTSRINKTEKIRYLSNKYNIIAVIGDRPSDILSAKDNNIPSILISSTITKDEEERLNNDIKNGGVVQLTKCKSWYKVKEVINEYYIGQNNLIEMRDEFIEHYASWLGEIDGKIQITVTISSLITAVTGKLLFDVVNSPIHQYSPIQQYSLMFILVLSFLSIIFSIRGFTSRIISGNESGNMVRIRIKQGIAILLEWPKPWLYREGDAIHEWLKMKGDPVYKQSKSHIVFFHKRYQTLDYDALKNIRLFELRKSNYEKLYAERIASNLLSYSLLLLIMWVLLTVFISATLIEQGKQEASKVEQQHSEEACK